MLVNRIFFFRRYDSGVWETEKALNWFCPKLNNYVWESEERCRIFEWYKRYTTWQLHCLHLVESTYEEVSSAVLR